jgi:hypothetical protein
VIQVAGQTKFTPEKVGQIKELVASGKSREEIAALIGVTVGSLQVTCSRLGVSLRRGARRSDNEITAATSNGGDNSRVPKTEQSQQKSRSGQMKQTQAATPHQKRASGNAVRAKFAIKMQYKGEERTTELPLTQDMIGQLALEAEFQDMRIGEFVGELFTATANKDLFQKVLPPDQNQGPKQVQRPSHANGSASAEASKPSETSD